MDAGVRVLLPVVLPDRSLIFRVAEQVGPGGPLALGRGRLGLLVPPATAPVVSLGEAGVVVVPALALDRAGRRLGRGGGSYDRALLKLADDAVAVGVVHPEELLERVPEEPHDQRVTHVLAAAELQRATPQP
jgi:5-formyltetrahydrofolate cyclo-ligase